VARILSAGHELLFVTNNSFSTVAAQEEVFRAIGIDASGRVLTASMAAASLLVPGSTAVVGGGPGVFAAVRERGVEAVAVSEAHSLPAGRVSDVIVGFHREFDFDRLHILSSLVRDGARLIGTNEDPTYPTPDGVIPGGGSILAAVATASGQIPIVAGKPHRAMAELVKRHVANRPTDNMWMVGDRLSTDGRFAALLGCNFAHVRSAVSESITDVSPTLSVSSFSTFVDLVLDGKVQ